MKRIGIVNPFMGLSAFVLTQTAYAIDVYTNDFEGTVGPEWSTAATDVTPIGERRFLGQFTNEDVRLSLGNIPAHTEITLSLKLFVLKTWDGNCVGNEIFPDVWTLKQDGVTSLLTTTFCNWLPGQGDPSISQQAYPEAFPGGIFPCMTGASERQSLGFISIDSGPPNQDAVYNLSFTVPHTSNNITYDFQGIALQEVSDESWGIDDVRVSVDGDPFGTFTPRAEFWLGPKPSDDSLWVRGWLKLANTTNGINPLTEAVTIKVGPFSHTLPAGSFVQDGSAYSFKGPVGPSTLEVRITPSSNLGGYSFKSCLKKGDLEATTLKPQVQLTIGDDQGQATLDVGYAKFGKGKDGQKWVFPPTK